MTDTQTSLIIQIDTIDSEEAQTTDARQLHAKLEIKKDFTDWIKYQIERFSLVEGLDFVMCVQKGFTATQEGSPILGNLETSGGSPILGNLKSLEQARTEYQLTVDVAKLISASSNTEKGKEVRSYLLAVEKDFRGLQLAQAVAKETQRMNLEYSEEASAIRGTSPTYDIGRKLTQAAHKVKPGKPWPLEVQKVIWLAQENAAQLQRLLETLDPDNVYEDDQAYANLEFERKHQEKLRLARLNPPVMGKFTH